MHMRFIPRLLILSFMLAFVVAGSNRFSAYASEMTDWTETKSEENVLVQSCDGFDITSSYTADIAHHLIVENTGEVALGRLNVDFAGSLDHSVTDKSYAYDGKFTRWSDYSHGKVSITDLELRFEVGTPGQFTVEVDRIEMDLIADPTEVIKKFVPNALQMELCYLMADSLNWNVSPVGAPELVPSFDERLGKNPSSNIHTENTPLPGAEVDSETEAMPSIQEIVYSEDSALPESVDLDQTPWTELDPCDTSPPGRPC